MGEIYKGIGGQVELVEKGLFVRRKGVFAKITMGLKGDKFLPFESISSVQFKKSGALSGYIQFGVLGGVESKGGIWDAAKDENTVVFTDNSRFEQLRIAVESKISRTAHKESVARISIADELEKLASLRERGFLTADEFEVQKASLLSQRP